MDTKISIRSRVEIPGFTIGRKIGQGGMASVYLAVQDCFDRPVVIKFMFSELTSENPSFITRFQDEGKLIAKLKHPNIIEVITSGEIAGQYYIVLDYLAGGDLKERIANSQYGKLDPFSALNVVLEIAKALNCTHEINIVHRDIKPANILFQADGKAVLTDFGIAKNLTSSVQLTEVGMLIGTTQYMSPEQFQSQIVDCRTDLYSLGIVFYEMLTGNATFDAKNEAVPKLPAGLGEYQAILDGLLEKNPNKRCPNAKVLINKIEKSLQRTTGPSTTYEKTRLIPDRKIINGRNISIFAVAIVFAVSIFKFLQLEAEGPPIESIKEVIAKQSDMITEPIIKTTRIKSGCFLMGSPNDEIGRGRDELLHLECIEHDFEIATHEVTQSLWQSVMFNNPSYVENCPSCPVENVSLNDIQSFIAKLNERTRETYLLPTEAQWEYAARAGNPAEYPWGEDLGSAKANCSECGSQWDGKKTTDVGSFRANAFGLFDTVGNVWEWTCSTYRKDYNSVDKLESKCAHERDQDARVLRGGSTFSPAEEVRSASRRKSNGRNGNYNIGFRLTRVIENT